MKLMGNSSMENPSRGRSMSIKQQHVVQELRSNAAHVSSMKLYLQAVCQFAFLSLCCVLTSVRQSEGAYVPGRCLCPQTQSGVRGQLKDLTVYQKSATCSNVTVIVTLKSNNAKVCLNPEAPMGKQLVRCWNKVQKLGRDVKLCLKRRRRRGGRRQRQQQRARGHKRRTLSSDSQ